MNRSGCGIRPKIRPVGSQRPATARGEPLGLAGYVVGRLAVGVGVLEDDLAGTRRAHRGRSSSAVTNRPSPCATGSSIGEGSSARRTARVPAVGTSVTQRDFEAARARSCARVDRAGRGPARQEAAPDQDLEAVADPQDQAATVVEAAQGVAQDGAEPGREDPAGAQVVAVGEAARDRQDLESIERIGRLEQPADVPGLDLGPGPLPGGRRLLVAVGSGRSQDDRAWSSHDRSWILDSGFWILDSDTADRCSNRATINTAARSGRSEIGNPSRRGRRGSGGSGRPRRPEPRSRPRS